MSFRLTALMTVLPSRARKNCCLPTCMSSWKAEMPAGALNDCTLLPDIAVTVPAVLSIDTTKTASARDS